MVSAASDIDQLKLVSTINLGGWGIGAKRGSILAQRDSRISLGDFFGPGCMIILHQINR